MFPTTVRVPPTFSLLVILDESNVANPVVDKVVNVVFPETSRSPPTVTTPLVVNDVIDKSGFTFKMLFSNINVEPIEKSNVLNAVNTKGSTPTIAGFVVC